jgi:hypothetical protein
MGSDRVRGKVCWNRAMGLVFRVWVRGACVPMKPWSSFWIWVVAFMSELWLVYTIWIDMMMNRFNYHCSSSSAGCTSLQTLAHTHTRLPCKIYSGTTPSEVAENAGSTPSYPCTSALRMSPTPKCKTLSASKLTHKYVKHRLIARTSREATLQSFVEEDLSQLRVS